MTSQPGILADLPDHSRYLELRLSGVPSSAAARLRSLCPGDRFVVGLGADLAERMDSAIDGLVGFPAMRHGELSIPSTQSDLWLWVRGDSADAVAAVADDLIEQLQGDFEVLRATQGFKHDGGRDLTGYEDGTENPQGEAAEAAAIRDGSSFVAVQQWRHDMDGFGKLSRDAQDDIIGRRRDTNEEFDAPASAHVKRTAQEDFAPEAFVVRRSSPWQDESGCGLMFVAFGCSFYAFDAQMRRMIGLDDGIVDGVFTISMPITGSYFWCPPLDAEGRLDLG